MTKALSFLTVLILLFSACKKDENSDAFCDAVEDEKWSSVEDAITEELINHTNSKWQKNCINLASELEDKDCVKSATADLTLLETRPQRTELTVQFKVTDSDIQTKTVLLEINETSGEITKCVDVK